jgi:hypothetical protein
MARATGKATKRRGGRRRPPPAKKRKKPTLDINTLAAAMARARTVVVAPSALTDPVGTDEARRGLPAFDPALLPELVILLHAAMQHFNLRRNSTSYPLKEKLVEFFMSVRLSNGRTLERHLAKAAATFVRPVSAMAGGRRKAVPRGKPAVSENC